MSNANIELEQATNATEQIQPLAIPKEKKPRSEKQIANTEKLVLLRKERAETIRQ